MRAGFFLALSRAGFPSGSFTRWVSFWPFHALGFLLALSCAQAAEAIERIKAQNEDRIPEAARNPVPLRAACLVPKKYRGPRVCAEPCSRLPLISRAQSDRGQLCRLGNTVAGAMFA